MKLGKAFSDTVIVEKRHAVHLSSDGQRAWWLGAGRALLFATLLFVVFFVLFFRLFSLTVVKGHEYRVLADGNRTRERTRHAPRGLLLDRTGKPLVVNVLQGLGYVRQYVYPSALAHVVGYTGELTEKELKDEYYTIRNYRPGDRVGRTGAEAVFEERLRGRDGRELVEVDASGNTLRILGRDSEKPGETITLSLDASIAQVAQDAFPAGYKGAVVVSVPKTGEILALYSSPTFSLNDFSQVLSDSAYKILIDHPDRPMFDRAIGGVYPPGSTFKLVTSLAGLETGTIDPQTVIEDVGVITIGPFSFPNWYFLKYGKTEGSMDIVRALKRSNDIFFYRVGEMVGITKLADWARRVGIGKPLGVELPGEATGLIPDPAWKNLNFVSKEEREARANLWYTGDTYHVAIGQGYLLTTPLQVNAWTNVIANGGKLCKPTLRRLTSLGQTNCKDLGIQKETIQLITEGMKQACDTGGTGWPLFEFKIQNSKFKIDEQESTPAASLTRVPVACKTGTAEFGDPQNRTHAWFTAFAPIPEELASKGVALKGSPVISGEPEISVTVLVEGAGEGSDVAAPVAKKILEEWFRR
ncbi:hypothetical protein HYV22_00950 [Candidatus Gottesmanbacteria bacterium]|nr:hypothetical protein [Candidatus Gottesmanbacteria bacterium]